MTCLYQTSSNHHYAQNCHIHITYNMLCYHMILMSQHNTLITYNLFVWRYLTWNISAVHFITLPIVQEYTYCYKQNYMAGFGLSYLTSCFTCTWLETVLISIYSWQDSVLASVSCHSSGSHGTVHKIFSHCLEYVSALRMVSSDVYDVITWHKCRLC